MRIAYTYHAFSMQQYGGVSRYFTELAPRVAALPGCEVALLAFAHINAHLPLTESSIVTGWSVPAVRRTGWLRRLMNDWLTHEYFEKTRPDVVHETYYASRGFTPSRAKTVLTVFDMTHERHPELFAPSDPTREAKAAAVRRADHVICISEHTRRDLIELLKVEPARTSVVYLGTSMAAGTDTPRAARPTPFLLFVGDRGGYKNFAGFRAAMLMRPSLQEVPVVCYGGGPFRREEFLPRHVEHVDGDDAELAALYASAAALVYPSRAEGFGLPALEAMACGCPVICSKAGSLPEIAGDAAEFFNPDDPASIAHAIERVLGSPARAAQLRQLGSQRARVFSWERCARETVAVYGRLSS